MLTPLYKKKKAFTIIVILISLIIIMNLSQWERERLTFVEDLIITVVSPFQNAVFWISTEVRDVFEHFSERQDMDRENSELKQSLGDYQSITNQLEELKQENKRLREMLDFREKSDYTLLPARVTARDTSGWFSVVVINKGYSDGAAKDMAVINNDGLVGHILSVSRNSSKVLLLSDSSRAVSGVVRDSRETGVIGFVEGSVEQPGYCRMINILRESEIEKGDVVVTSGLGGVFPPGLVIGQVIEVGDDEYGLLKYALIKPAVDFSRLEEVFVVQSTHTWVYPEEEDLEEE
ncbi:MAG: rod shape-determining protein MreC [Candidatus Contubernalis sp.]|nr:rod shape-determining protein MreC [Candidatus Contubernalis sp.]